MEASDVLESQNQLRLSNTGCDVIFEIGPKSFPAHRLALMARLKYFRSMFTTDMREKKELTVQFDPLIIDPDCFGEVLDYIYTLKIDFTDENIRAIYRTADYFCFDELIAKVMEHMEKGLKVENAVLYRDIGIEFNLEGFENRCEQFIVENSNSDAIKNQLIPAFSFEELKEFVGKLKENAKFEEMFNYCVDWILHDKATRTGTFFELFIDIPLKSLSLWFIKQNVSNNELVLKDNDCLALLLNTIPTILETKEFEVLYAIGGTDGENLSSVSEYNNTTDKWISSISMPSQRFAFGCAVIGQKIYICGGHIRGHNTKNDLTVFDIDTQRWTELTPMKYARYHCATAVLNGQIYVAGGRNIDDRLAVMERYNVQTDRWEDVASMTTIRSGLELVALNGFLYAIGGYDGTYELESVERYDPQTDQWIRMNNTNNKYSSFGSAVWNGNIYIVGDDTSEVYSAAEDKWTEMPAPTTKCDYGRRLTVCNGRLYAIGGLVGELEEFKGVKTVDVYDFQACVWRQEPDMDVARFHHQIAVVKSCYTSHSDY